LAIVIGMERFSLLKVIGIVVGAAGAMFASVYGVEDSGVSSERLLYGSLCFFINCSGAAMYAIVAKRLLELSKYFTLSVLGWSYTVAAALSAAITTACGSSPAARVCLVASRQAASCIWSLGYFLVMNSMLAYGLNAWAVRHAPPSVVTNFCVLQPVVAIALSLVLLSTDH
jgi:drug/metabolite transporter (DMT)-like permease